jgi:hypothetical protein
VAVCAHASTLLNLNDCGASTELHAIKELVGGMDVPTTQFSYAQWVNNHHAVQHRLEHDRGVLENVKLQIEVLKPRYVIPLRVSPGSVQRTIST